MSFGATGFRLFARSGWGGASEFRAAVALPYLQPNNAVDPQTLGPNQWGQIGNLVYRGILAQKTPMLSGISYASNGSTLLPNCQVLVFTTVDKRLVAETVSDGSGNWSVPMPITGPFFTVEYLVGSPDVAGTSVNTLLPS